MYIRTQRALAVGVSGEKIMALSGVDIMIDNSFKSFYQIMEELSSKLKKDQDCFVPMDSNKEFHYYCEGNRGVICARCKKHYDE